MSSEALIQVIVKRSGWRLPEAAGAGMPLFYFKKNAENDCFRRKGEKDEYFKKKGNL